MVHELDIHKAALGTDPEDSRATPDRFAQSAELDELLADPTPNRTDTGPQRWHVPKRWRSSRLARPRLLPVGEDDLARREALLPEDARVTVSWYLMRLMTRIRGSRKGKTAGTATDGLNA
jgi:hypothetical protein